MPLAMRFSISMTASGEDATLNQIGVRVAPGVTTLTLIRRGESLEANTRPMGLTPALLAA
jgi:hypothetical protein